MRFLSASVLTCAMHLFVSNSAHAALVFAVEVDPLIVGGTSSVVVSVTGNSDPIQSIFLNLQVASVGAVGSSVQFTPPDSTDTLNEGDYLFPNGSNLNMTSDPAGIDTLMQPNDTATWIDSANTLNNELVTTRRIAAEFNIQHIFPSMTDPTLIAGDQFQFTLSGSYADASFTTTNIAPTSAVVNTTAVPEPGTLATLGIAFTALVSARFRQRRLRKMI